MVAIIRGTQVPTVQSLLPQERGGLTVDANISHSIMNHQHSDTVFVWSMSAKNLRSVEARQSMRKSAIQE